MAYQTSLLNAEPELVTVKDGSYQYLEQFLSETHARGLFEELKHSLNWRQESLTIFGRTVKAPRLSVWMANKGSTYRYSQTTHHPEPWHPMVAELRERINSETANAFNAVLINYYRDGQDSNGWHSDDEPELGPDPVVASVSLGGTRDFLLRHKTESSYKQRLALKNGSLLIMQSGMQTHWQHQLPKRASAEPRINLTFRTLISASN